MTAERTAMLVLAVLLASATMPVSVRAQQSVSLAGTAKDEAKKPYADYTVRARNIRAGAIVATVPLDVQGSFALPGLSAENYLVELVNRDGRVVCTEGPVDLSRQTAVRDLVIDCGNVPAAWWLIGAAAAAGITAGVVAVGPASAAR